MAERIYIKEDKEEGGAITWVDEEPFSTEEKLQALIAEHPGLLVEEQVFPDAPGRWMIVAPEVKIAVSPNAGNSLWVDLVLVDQDATPTLVEVKLRSNSEIHRTIIGQLLVYAAYATHTWTETNLRQRFQEYASSRKRDLNEELANLLRKSEPDGEPDVDSFWKDVATNLAAKNIRLLFVVDDIPDDLERAVEFLNAQMQRIEVLAVEIKQFRRGSTRTLVPRVIGRTAASSTRSTARQPKLTRDTFLGHFLDKEQQNAAIRFLNHSEKLGCALVYATKSVSIRMTCSLWPTPVILARVCIPSDERWFNERAFSFEGSYQGEPSYPDSVEEVLDEWLGQLSRDGFAGPLPGWVCPVWAIQHDDSVLQIDLLESRLTEIVEKLNALSSED